MYHILWTISLNPGRFMVIVQSGCISNHCREINLHYSSPKNKKDRLGAIPNRSYHHFQRVYCDFSPRIVAFTRCFHLFLSISKKRITQTLYQYLRDWMAPQVGLEPTTLRLTAECSAIELLRNILKCGSDLLSRAVSSQVPSAC